MILNPGDIAIDYSSARPLPSMIVACGVRLVVRYISVTRANTKNLTRAERDGLLEAGLGLLLVWEQGAADAAQGAITGERHGTLAQAFADELGYPLELPILVAVDFDVTTQMLAVLHYIEAFRRAAGRPIGVYGEADVITAAGSSGWSDLGWQTRAWSHGQLSPHAHVRQEIGFIHPSIYRVEPITGAKISLLGNVDDNTVLKTVTAWSTGAQPPAPQPPTTGAQEMGYVRNADNGDFWLIFWDAYGRRVALPLRETEDSDWTEFDPVQAAIGPLPAVPGAALQRLYDKRGRPTPVPGSTPMPNHSHKGGETGGVA